MNPTTRSLLTLLVTLTLVRGVDPQGRAAAGASLTGPALGVWELPTSTPNGFLMGALRSVDRSLTLYTFQAALTGVESPCLSCIEGGITGTLDDGVGPGPDFDVRGAYFGSWFDGTV